jgi:hypothetical protein
MQVRPTKASQYTVAEHGEMAMTAEPVEREII